MATSAETTLRPVPTTGGGEGDHDRFAHIVPKHELTRALVEGVEVTALCGKKWVPHRDPERYPVCPTCAERLAQLRAGGTGDGGSGGAGGPS